MRAINQTLGKKQGIYLDNNATTPIHPEVAQAFKKSLSIFGNPSSIHYAGRQAYEALENARDSVASLLGVASDTLIFTSSGTEANNHVLQALIQPHATTQKPHIITSAIEHSSVKETCRFLERIGAATVSRIPVDTQGVIDLEALEKSITPETKLIFIMTANNEVGTIQPQADIVKIAQKHGILCGTDAVQAVGKIPLNAEELGVDFLTLSSHKLYAPKGSGALYIKPGVSLYPLIYGGAHERRLRGGTQNVPGIIALGKAAQLLKEHDQTEVQKLTTQFTEGVFSSIPDVFLNGHPELRIPGTVNLSFKGVSGEALLMNLDQLGIAVSTGSACSTGSIEPSSVLQAMEVPEDLIQCAVRFSIGQFNTHEEIEHVLKLLPTLVQKLRIP